MKKQKKIKPCTPNKVESWKRKKLQAQDVRKQRVTEAENTAIETACRLFPYFRY